MEAEKQVKFFQGCVAAAFSERDNAIMEVIAGLDFFFSLVFISILSLSMLILLHPYTTATFVQYFVLHF